MIIKKNITTAIDIRNPIGLYSDEGNLLSILRERYVGRCHAHCLVLSVDGIISQSEGIVNIEGVPDFITISVTIVVTAIAYAKGEMVHGCRLVKKMPNGQFNVSSRHISANIAPNAKYGAIAEGSLVSIIIVDSSYPINGTQINAAGVMFDFSPIPMIYKLPSVSIARYANTIRALQAKVTEEETLADELRSRSPESAEGWLQLSKLLYAYHSEPALPHGAIKLNLNDIMRGDGIPDGVKYICISSNNNPSTPYFFGYKKKADIPANAIKGCNHPLTDILAIMVNHYTGALVMIREMLQIYTGKLFTDHRALWRLLSSAKLDNVAHNARR